MTSGKVEIGTDSTTFYLTGLPTSTAEESGRLGFAFGSVAFMSEIPVFRKLYDRTRPEEEGLSAEEISEYSEDLYQALKAARVDANKEYYINEKQEAYFDIPEDNLPENFDPENPKIIEAMDHAISSNSGETQKYLAGLLFAISGKTPSENDFANFDSMSIDKDPRSRSDRLSYLFEDIIPKANRSQLVQDLENHRIKLTLTVDGRELDYYDEFIKFYSTTEEYEQYHKTLEAFREVQETTEQELKQKQDELDSLTDTKKKLEEQLKKLQENEGKTRDIKEVKKELLQREGEFFRLEGIVSQKTEECSGVIYTIMSKTTGTFRAALEKANKDHEEKGTEYFLQEHLGLNGAEIDIFVSSVNQKSIQAIPLMMSIISNSKSSPSGDGVKVGKKDIIVKIKGRRLKEITCKSQLEATNTFDIEAGAFTYADCNVTARYDLGAQTREATTLPFMSPAKVIRAHYTLRESEDGQLIRSEQTIQIPRKFTSPRRTQRAMTLMDQLTGGEKMEPPVRPPSNTLSRRASQARAPHTMAVRKRLQSGEDPLSR